MNPLLELIEHGQSYWLDNLTRRMIQSGALKRRVTREGLRGVTSNPAIFNKAISGSDDYDDQIRDLVPRGLTIPEIYEELVVADVREACDVLRPVYRSSGGGDGFVSLEVSPYLAHDTEGTMVEARRLAKAVNRPNLFIKIPGTPAGVPAIEEMLYEGININITLLFSIESYEAVALAYVKALERRLAEKKPVDRLASVASFFLSRIDTLADQLLGHRIRPESDGKGPRPEELFGQVAVANARLAYQKFKEIFSGRAWKALEARGARFQRLLWASTSTKDPLYHDVYYVEPLVGAHTVNTMPDETVEAFAERGRILPGSIEEGVEEAEKALRAVRRVGLNLSLITEQLQNEGAQKFIDPYDQLMATLARKREALLSGRVNRMTPSLGASKGPVAATWASLNRRQFSRRLHARDPLLWKEEREAAQAIRSRLGWLCSVEDFKGRLEEIRDFAGSVRKAGYRQVVLLGMGGSSLCPELFGRLFGPARGWPSLTVLDNTDPGAVREVESRARREKTLFLVASKSGSTEETDSFYRYFYHRIRDRRGERAGEDFVAITDAGSPLAEEAGRRAFRSCFENPSDIGGRYSALSYFGLVPLALLGADPEEVLVRAREMKIGSGPFVPVEASPAVQLGAALGILARRGRDKLTLVCSPSLLALGDWVEQLVAESTGKDGLGLVPVVGEPLGAPRVYGEDRVFVRLKLQGEDEKGVEARLAALEKAGHPVFRIELPDRPAVGAEFYRWEVATVAAASVLGVNPFDEPNVAESKKNTGNLLKEWKSAGSFAEEAPGAESDGLRLYASLPGESRGKKVRPAAILKGILDTLKPGDYLALLPYFQAKPRRESRLRSLRLEVRNRHRVATTLGYGPRYLHSTGQLHKGGPGKGVFILITADPVETIPVPGKGYDFGTLQRAQAVGDFRSLEQRGRRVLRIHLGSGIEAGLGEVVGWL